MTRSEFFKIIAKDLKDSFVNELVEPPHILNLKNKIIVRPIPKKVNLNGKSK